MKELPVRKPNRLKEYDYSQNGNYFVTVCVKNRHEMLGNIVGDGVLDVPYVRLSEYGNITKKHIDAIGSHYDHVTIQEFVVMPNHVHLYIFVNGRDRVENGTSRTPSPTNADINAKTVCTP